MNHTDCIEAFEPDFTLCLPKCEGLLITSYLKTENGNNVVDAKMFKQYNKYKEGVMSFPEQLKGLCVILFGNLNSYNT